MEITKTIRCKLIGLTKRKLELLNTGLAFLFTVLEAVLRLL